MWEYLSLASAAALFALGLYLSAFFSGSETGFYRASFLRLSIDAQSGDRTAARLLWFTQNPSYFVATTLIGNNVANYLATMAIGIATAVFVHVESDWVEILTTLMVSPIVFVFGELMPKSLYYRAPLKLLRRNVRLFTVFFRLFLIVSWPLVWITKLFEQFGSREHRAVELALGRKRLVQVLSQGHQQGLLTEVQGHLVQGLLTTAGQPVTESMTPAGRVLGVDENSTREQILEYARHYGLTSVALKRAGAQDEWFGYVRVADIAVVTRRPLKSLVRTMPVIAHSASKLEAMLALRTAGAAYGVVSDGARILGTVSERGLIERLIRPTTDLRGAMFQTFEDNTIHTTNPPVATAGRSAARVKSTESS